MAESERRGGVRDWAGDAHAVRAVASRARPAPRLIGRPRPAGGWRRHHADRAGIRLAVAMGPVSLPALPQPGGAPGPRPVAHDRAAALPGAERRHRVAPAVERVA